MCDLVGNIKGSDFYSKSDGIDGGISSRGMTLSDLHSCKVAPTSMGRMDWGGEWQQGKLLGRIAEVQATNAGDFEYDGNSRDGMIQAIYFLSLETTGPSDGWYVD